jgi:hypothetical protein
MEKHFKQKIEGLDSVPPGMKHDREASWSRIETGLRDRRRRKAVLRLLAAASLAIPLMWGVSEFVASRQEAKDWKELAAQTSLDSLMKQGQALGYQPEMPMGMPAITRRKLTQVERLEIELRIVRKAIEIEKEQQKLAIAKLAQEGDTVAIGFVAAAVAGLYSSTIYGTSSQPQGQQYRLQQSNWLAITADDLAGTSDMQYFRSGGQNASALTPIGDKLVTKEQSQNATPTPSALNKGKLGFKSNNESSAMGEGYGHFIENAPIAAAENAFSTFGLDVDVASYGNIRRFLQMQGAMPPTDAVRIEEMVNYFDYNYPKPTGTLPIEMVVESGPCPWNEEAQLVQIGMQAKEVEKAEMAPANLVFLIDVSGSMSEDLELVKGSLRKLVKELRPQDHVSIVVYAGAAGQVLPSTPGTDKAAILAALNRLQAGGSTAGG